MTVENDFWVLKTSEGRGGRSHWDEFRSEKVVAIGWPKLTVNPVAIRFDALIKAIAQKYPRQPAPRTARKIIAFAEKLKKDDWVIICRGYSPNQIRDVHLFGIAKISGKFNYDADSKWWKFKRKAEIQPIEKDIPKRFFTDALNKHSLLETIHMIEKDSYQQFCKKLITIGFNIGLGQSLEPVYRNHQILNSLNKRG